MICRSDDPILRQLQDDLARLARVQALPEDERAKWTAGIAKLERRIEEERAACGITLEYFGRRYYAALDGLQHGMYGDKDLVWLCELSIEASRAYTAADPERLESAFERMDKQARKLRAVG